MKKLFYTIVLLATIASIAMLSSCSDNDDYDFIAGRWQLVQVDYHFGGIKNCSEQNIEYQFLSKGLLLVVDNSAELGIFLETGEHQYTLNEKANQIIVDGLTYSYQINKYELIIDTGSAWDSPVYFFKHLI